MNHKGEISFHNSAAKDHLLLRYFIFQARFSVTAFCRLPHAILTKITVRISSVNWVSPFKKSGNAGDHKKLEENRTTFTRTTQEKLARCPTSIMICTNEINSHKHKLQFTFSD